MTIKKAKIFLVDDDPIVLKVMEKQFQEKTSFIIKTFSTGEACIAAIAEKPDVIFLDFYLNSVDTNSSNGLEILDQIKAINPEIEVVMVSSQDNMDVAIKCMKHLAFDYIVKSETTFVRAQKAILSILYQQKLSKEVTYYKNATMAVSILIGLIIIITIILKVYHPDVLDR